jgi:hypothetical protein
MRAKAQICEMCGSREVDWIDPKTGRILEQPKYTPVGIKCHGCAEVEQYKSSTFGDDGIPAGVRVVLFPDELVDQDGRLLTGPQT